MHMPEPTRILIVDDDRGNALLAKEAIASYFGNCSVDIAGDGKECMRLLGQKAYDVILLDQSLPDVEGLLLFNNYKKAGFDIPTVMVTGTGNEEVAVEAMKAGVYDYVVKTADLGYLKEIDFSM
ncbi:MAG TPA: response regulator [Candidatus Latescibacteria bacterium]|nr:response regulator [Candidatus Latescibacterota bacterium]